MFDTTTKFDVGDSVFYFRGVLREYKIQEIYYRCTTEQKVHYTIRNKDGHIVEYVGEKSLFVSKAQAVAKYIKDFE